MEEDDMAKLSLVLEADFDDTVLNADQLMVVDFTGEDCVPCRLMEPILEQLSNEYEQDVGFVSVDVGTSPDTAGKYKVRGIPTFLFFRNGEQVDRLTGAIPKAIFKSRIDRALKY
jgi:thioredoxin 1